MTKEDLEFIELCYYRTKVLNDKIKFLDIKKIAIELSEKQNRTFEYVYSFLIEPSHLN